MEPCGFKHRLIYKVFEFLFIRYRKCAFLLLMITLEIISVVLEKIGGSNRYIRLALFLLSLIGFSINAIVCYKKKCARTQAQWEEMEVVEIVFSVIQVVGSLSQLILILSGKKTYDVCLHALASVIISLWFALKKHGGIVHTSPEDQISEHPPTLFGSDHIVEIDEPEGKSTEAVEMDEPEVKSTEVSSTKENTANTSLGNQLGLRHRKVKSTRSGIRITKHTTAVEIFSKYLTNTDVTAGRLDVPTSALHLLPPFGEGMDFLVKDLDEEKVWDFRYSIRQRGQLEKPATITGDWPNFVGYKRLVSGDLVIFYKLNEKDEASGAEYAIEGMYKLTPVTGEEIHPIAT